MARFRLFFAVMSVAMLAPMQAARAQVPSSRQTPPASATSRQTLTPSHAKNRSIPVPTERPQIQRPDLVGKWSGTLIQVQQSIEYSVAVEISAQGASINYPEFGCGGTLTRIGGTARYVFFIETITIQAIDKIQKCQNGAITVARIGDNLAWEWFCVINGDQAVAVGTLSRDPDGGQAAIRSE